MGGYRFTRRGKLALWITVGLAMMVFSLGSIYLAVFGFVFCSIGLIVSLYEMYFNK